MGELIILRYGTYDTEAEAQAAHAANIAACKAAGITVVVPA